MTVLVVAPHPDDESIGCGGALCLHARRGDRCVVAYLTSGEHALKHLAVVDARAVREAEAAEAAKLLGVARMAFLRGPDWFLQQEPSLVTGRLAELLQEEKPQVVFVPHAHEGHPDHQAALPIYRQASSELGHAPEVLTYEVWSPMHDYNHLINISDVMTEKLRAIRCFKSQLSAFRYDHAIRGLNRYRGVLHAQWRYAEAYRHLTTRSEQITAGILERP